MTGFIPAGQEQYMQMCESSDLSLTINSSELMKGKVQRKQCGTPGRTRLGRRGAWTLHHRTRQRRALTRKDNTRSTFGANFLVFGGWLKKARAEGTGRKSLAPEAIREVEPSGLTTWMTPKFPPWAGVRAHKKNYKEARYSDLDDLDLRCGVQDIRASAHD